MRHEARQDLQRHVLERGSRAVEQFEHVIVAQGLERGDALVGPLFAVGVGDALAQLLGREVRQQRAQHLGGDLLVRLARQATSTLVLPNASETNRPPSSAMPLRIACLAVSESVVLRVEWKVVVTMNPSA